MLSLPFLPCRTVILGIAPNLKNRLLTISLLEKCLLHIFVYLVGVQCGRLITCNHALLREDQHKNKNKFIFFFIGWKWSKIDT